MHFLEAWQFHGSTNNEWALPNGYQPLLNNNRARILAKVSDSLNFVPLYHLEPGPNRLRQLAEGLWYMAT